MIFEADLSDAALAAKIHAVAQAAYALEAERIGCADFPPLRESAAAWQDSSDRFLVFQQSGIVLGALSFAGGPGPVTITRLVVSPAHLRQGIATALLAALERLWPSTEFSVSTAQANAAAVSLYLGLGFAVASTSSSPEGIALVRLSRPKRSPLQHRFFEP